jgi:tetraacyldisaccharide 4'-kinase
VILRPRPWLGALGAAYGAVGAVRAALHARGLLATHRLRGPVISVGNLAVGGRGKTPMAARVAEWVRDDGLPVAILSRGYAGSFDGDVLVVSDGATERADAALAGDEPVMLARRLPGVVVAVGPRRDVVGRAVEQRFGPRVHVLDDGFQHLRLFRDLDLVCLRAHDLFDVPLPAGALRERAGAAARADVLLVWDDPAPAGLFPGRVFRVRRRPAGFFDREGRAADAPRRPFLVAGIAHPERLEDDVRALTDAVAGRAFFADHHRYRADDVARVESEAARAGADVLVTTEKDLTRLPHTTLPALALRIAPEIEDEERLRARVLAVARRVREVRA